MTAKPITLILLFSWATAQASELIVTKAALLSSGNVTSVHRTEEGFFVTKDGKRHEVQSCLIDKRLRNLSTENLAKLLTVARLSVHEVGNNEFSIKANAIGKGGGPIAGAIAYWFTKSVCYGTAVAAATTAVVATGGAAGAVTGALVAGGTAGASTGATIVAGAIAGGGYAAEAATLTSATVMASGSIASAVAAVEVASTSASIFFTCIPFLP